MLPLIVSLGATRLRSPKRGDKVRYKDLVALIAVLALSLVSIDVCAQSAPALAKSFVPPSGTAAMNTGRYDAASTLLQSGNLLLAGGGGPTGPFLNTLELYRYRTNTFAPSANLPQMSTLRANETATLLPNGKVLIAGGAVDNSTWTDTTDIFDPVARTITAGPRMSNQREGATAKLLPNGLVLIAGGRDSGGTLNTVDLYNPAKKSITPGPLMNVARYDCAAVILPNGNLMIFGGFGAVTQAQPLDSTEIYNPSLNKWATSPPTMMDARGGARATPLSNGRVLITGGTDATTGVLNTTEIYNPVNRTFTAGPDMNDPRKFHTQVRLANGQVLIAGGYSDNTGTAVLDTTDIYHPATGTITTGPLMNDRRGLAAGARFANGLVLIAGGSNGTIILDTTDLYVP
jgi:hypothetical protein